MTVSPQCASEVVVTGVGAITAAGLGVAPLVDALRRGQTLLAQHDDEPWPTGRVDARCVAWPPGPAWADIRKYAGSASQLAVAAAALALEDAKIATDRIDARASGTVVVVEPDQSAWDALTAVVVAEDARPVGRRIYEDLDDFHILRSIPTQVSNFVARRAGFTGPQLTVARPSIGGISGLAQAIGLIQSREVDRVILATADPRWSPYELAALDRVEPFATTVGPRAGPFDQNRGGPFWGEGAAAVLLERRDVALRRRARIWARVVACETRCCSTGAGASIERAIEAVLARVPRPPQAIWAHGTGSRTGDRLQAEALATQVQAPITATHGAIGTLYAGSAIIDLIAAAAFLAAEEIPPVCLLDHPDFELGRLDFVCREPRNIPGAEVALVTAVAHPREADAGAVCIAREARP